MFFDAAEGDRGRFAREFDVCIIGAGPAGITLARSLAGHGFEVALMEGGGLDVSVESQDQYVGEIVGMDYVDLDAVRLRVFGGCSEHWSGECRAFAAEDFEPLPQRPRAWPIRKADLDPYQPAAAHILDLARPVMPADLPMTGDRFRGTPVQHSAPTRFGQKYHDEIAAAPRIACGLNANLVDLVLDSDLATVVGAEFRSYAPDDPGFTVKARTYCLCLGGLENPRMLLNFNRQKPQGIGNDHDLVGRTFCEHPSRKVADIRYTHRQELEQARVGPTPGFLRAEGTLDFTFRVEWRDYPPDPLVKALKSGAKCAMPALRRMAETPQGPAPCRWGGAVEEFLVRRYPDSHPTGWAFMVTEQALNPDSRVTLAESVDDFGLRRLRLDWLLGDAPRMPAGVDIVHGGEWNGGYHQMCTTRMADDPREGVVDRNCRVHGTENLYIGGSSVFGTPGAVPPTFTIVQLALRLGDHLDATRLAGVRATGTGQ